MTVFIMVFSVFFVAGISHSGSRLFSDVILICHHHPDLVHEVVGDAGGRVGPGAGQSVEAGRGWVRGYILIQEVAHIRETLTLQERNHQFPMMSKQTKIRSFLSDKIISIIDNLRICCGRRSLHSRSPESHSRNHSRYLQCHQSPGWRTGKTGAQPDLEYVTVRKKILHLEVKS